MYRKIAKQINEATRLDQDIHLGFIDSGYKDENLRLKMIEVDNQNTALIKEIIKKIGYPTISRVGRKASFNTWILIQHSTDLDFMMECLKLMEENKDDINPQNIAYLKDKVLMWQKKPQVYGTQAMVNKETYKPELYEVEDIEHLNERRLAMGLETIEKYLEGF